MSENLFKELVEEVLNENAREEGLQILKIGSDNRGEWEKYLKDAVDNYITGREEEDSSSYNTVCMALDFAKYNLVNANLMEQKPTDHFGDIDWMFHLDNNEEE